MVFLIVDASSAMQTIITKSLKSMGLSSTQCHVAGDGADALAQLREHKPSLVLASATLTDMSGPELVRQIKQLGSAARTGLLTFDPTPALLQEATAAGAAFVLEKPFSSEQLHAAIRAALPPDKVPDTGAEAALLLPSPAATGQLLTSLSGQSLTIIPGTLDQLTDANTPFFAASYEDGDGRVRASLVLDQPAVNLIHTLLDPISVRAATSTSLLRAADPLHYRAALLLSKLMALLIRQPGEVTPLDLHGVHEVKLPHKVIYPFFREHAAGLNVMQIHLPAHPQAGLLILCRH